MDTPINTIKELTLYFINCAEIPVTKENIIKQTVAIKNLLRDGFTLDEIRYGIDYFIYVSPPFNGLYSISYLKKTLKSVLENPIPIVKEKKYNSLEFVENDLNDSTENNRRKFDTESGFGKKYSFDMFKKPGENA